MKHKFTLFTLFLLFCFSANLNAQKKANLQQANKEYELHAFSLAINSYKKVLDKDPKNVSAIAGIANSYWHLGYMEEAANWYKSAIQLAGVDPINLFQYGKTLMALGEYEKALDWFLIYAEGQRVYGNHYAESCRFALSLRGMPGLYRVKKEYSNTTASDFGPAFLGDNVVFSSARTDMVRKLEKNNSGWNGQVKNQLFLSGVDDKGYLTKPQFLRNDLQNVYNEGPISYSSDGRWVAFTKNNFVNGTRQIPSSGFEGSIFLAEANLDGSWNEVSAFPHNGSGYSSAYPSLSADGKKMYFASDRPDGFGGYDIYVSYRIGGSWTAPENLGPVINSAGNEISPFMDKGVLYFASDWHHGLGGFDIFRALAEDGLWSKVFHLGNTVNSSYDDYGFIYNNEKNGGYFVSNRKGGAGNEDIYQVSKISEDVTIVVVEAGSNKPLEGATLDFSACGEKNYPTDAYGKYRFQVFDGLNCNVVVSLKGHKSTVLQMNHPAERENKTYTVALEAAPNLLSGLIFSAIDNRPIGDVVITVKEKGQENAIRTRSTSNGAYELDLKPNTSYIIRYSKVGYLDTHQKIETEEPINKNILGMVVLNSSGTNLDSGNEVATNSSSSTSSSNSSSTSSTGTGTFETNNSGGSSTTTQTGSSTSSSSGQGSVIDEPAAVVQEGFSVQIAAFGLTEVINTGKYTKLKGIGNLYSRPNKGMKKIRVGIYTTRADAEEARKSVVAKGFSSAFIVPERVERLDEIEIFDHAPPTQVKQIPGTEVVKAKPPTEVNYETIPETKTTTAETKSIFMVRLATYAKPEFFDPSKVNTIGKIEQRLKGKMTIMLLSGFPSLQAARKASGKAAKAGFKGAHVVMEENGKLIKI